MLQSCVCGLRAPIVRLACSVVQLCGQERVGSCAGEGKREMMCMCCEARCVQVDGSVDVAELCLWVAGTYCAVGVLCGAAVWAGAGGELRRRGKTGDDVYVL